VARILGVDPGTKRCGIAVSDSRETMAFPRPALAMNDQFVPSLRALAAEEEIELVVVGRPVSLAGNDTASTTFADDVFATLSASLELPVVQSDERLSTTQALRSFAEAGVSQKQSRDRIDSAAAVILLQHYLEVRRGA
jgi:putative Holliday junction resolvase